MFKLVRKENFNLGRAELDVWYELWQTYTNWRGKEITKPVTMHYGEMSTIPYRGDYQWAKKIAKHYKLPSPKPLSKGSKLIGKG